MRTSGLVFLLAAMHIYSLRAQEQQKFTFHGGGGISTPLNPTGAYAGLSGNVALGAGYNINQRNAIVAEFLWSGLPANAYILQPPQSLYNSINLFTLTVNYRRHFDRINGSVFGLYFVAGGGWYYRYVSIDKDWIVPPGTPCLPVYYWWGYSCTPDGYVYTQTLASKGSSSGGVNSGVGFTIRLSDSNWRFFTEARYHYGFTQKIPSTLVPVTIGFRYN